MTKNMIIGIGGTGLSAIREIRRLIAERYPEGLADPAVTGVRFIYIDTDREDAGRRNYWTVLGKDIALRQDSEKIDVTGDNLQAIVANPRDYPDIDGWLPRIADFVGEPGEGAKGIRPYGRLIYQYKENRGRIREAINNAWSSLNEALPHEPQWRFYLIAGLSGGTGSGMFLPLAQDLEEWKLFRRGTANQKFRAFLVLPPLQITGRHNRYHANAFAALREVNYLGVNGKLPFTSTYLLEPINAAGSDIGLDNLPLLIAQRVFLNIQGGEAAQAIDALMDNPNLGNLEIDDSRRKHSLAFSSFGLSSIAYPREMIARTVSLEWVIRLVENWLSERELPRNVNEVVRTDLPRLRLSRLHVNGDADPFGSNDHPPHELELPRIVDGRIGPLQKKQLGAAGHPIREEIETTFRQVGIEKFYQQREKDVSRAAEFALLQVRFNVSRQLRDPERGLRFAKEYLQELRNILEQEQKADTAARCSEPAQHQVAVFQRNYAETVNTISQHERQMLYLNGEFARDKANMEDDLKGYLVRVASFCSAKYGMSLLDRVIPAVIQLRASIDIWEARISELRDKLRGKLKVVLAGRAQSARENGTVIFDEKVLTAVAGEAPGEVVNAALELRLREKLASRLGSAFDDLDLFLLDKIPEIEDMLAETAFEYILSQDSPVDIRRTTLYDRFVTEYPTSAARREVMQKTRALSHVFIHSVAEEIGRGNVQTSQASVVSIPSVIGRVTREGQEAQTVIRGELEAIGVNPRSVQATQDVERIIFVSEKQAFPIRFIESVKELRKYYDQFPIKEALHIDRADAGKLYELFLLSDSERRAIHQAEEAFLLGRARSWVAVVNNQQTLKPEVRFEYGVPARIGKRSANFGGDWDSAFDRFTQDAISATPPDGVFREGRTLLTERCSGQRKAAETDPVLRQEIESVLRGYLDDTLSTYRARTDDPRYIRDMGIIDRIMESLYTQGTAAGSH